VLTFFQERPILSLETTMKQTLVLARREALLEILAEETNSSSGESDLSSFVPATATGPSHDGSSGIARGAFRLISKLLRN
jgi:hypothetical protein